MRLDSMVALAVAAEHDFLLSGAKARVLDTPEAWAAAVKAGRKAHQAWALANKQTIGS